MRGERSVPRGEAGRVAVRVRQLLDDDEADDDYEADDDGADDDGADDDGADDDGPTSWQRLRARVPVRIDPGRRAAWGVGAAVILAAIVTGLWLVSSRPAPVPVAARVPQVPGAEVSPTAGPRSGGTAAGATAAGSPVASSPSPSPSGVVVVDVAGKVRRPGLYRLPSGSRIDDAVTAAGGARPGVDLSSLNLAAPLADGQQILVGAPAGAQGPVTGGTPAGSAASGGGASSTGPVDLNTATLDQLDTLPGIGPALAQRILDFRSQHGRFGTVDQLNDVSGIGDVKFAELKSLVTV